MLAEPERFAGRGGKRFQPAPVQDQFDFLGIAGDELDDRQVGSDLGFRQPLRVPAEAVIEPDQVGGNRIEYQSTGFFAQFLIFLMQAIDDSFPMRSPGVRFSALLFEQP